ERCGLGESGRDISAWLYTIFPPACGGDRGGARPLDKTSPDSRAVADALPRPDVPCAPDPVQAYGRVPGAGGIMELDARDAHAGIARDTRTHAFRLHWPRRANLRECRRSGDLCGCV